MQIKTLDDFMTKFNFSSSKLSKVINSLSKGKISRRSISDWRMGVIIPRDKNIEKLQRVVIQYLPKKKARDFFPKVKAKKEDNKKSLK